MRKIFIILVFVTSALCSLRAQVAVEFNENQKEIYKKIDSLNHHAKDVLDNSIFRSFQIANKSFELSIKSSYDKGMINSLSQLISTSSLLYGDIVSEGLGDFGEYILKNYPKSDVKCKLMLSIGTHYIYKSNYEKATKFFINATELAESNGYIEILPDIYHNWGWFYQLIGDNENSADNYTKSVQYYKNINDTLNMIISMHLAAQGNIAIGNYQIADKIIHELFEFKDYDKNPAIAGYYYKILGLLELNYKKNYETALKHFYTSAEFFEKTNSRQFLSDVSTIIAHMYSLKSDYKMSLEYNYKAMKLRTDLQSKHGLYSSFNNIGIDYFHLGKIDSALYFLHLARSKSKAAKIHNFYLRALDWLHKIHLSQNRLDSAVYYLKLHKTQSESFNYLEVARNSIKYQLKNELNLKDDDLLEMSLQSERRRNIYLASSLSMLIIIIIILVIRNRQRKKDNLILEEQKSMLEKANIEINISHDELIKLNKELDSIVQERTNHLTSEIEHRKIAEEQLLQSREKILDSYNKEKDLNALKSRFISMISHEFRTPLTVISTSSDIIKYHKDKSSFEQIDQLAERIKNSVNQMTYLIDDIISFNSNQEQSYLINLEYFDLKEFVKEIINEQKVTYRTSRNVEFVFDSSNHFINSDKKLLRHILGNLIGNSIKYTEETRSISVTINKKSILHEFIISDNGIGIPEKDLKNLFEPFFRGTNIGNIAGTGFGLYLVKEYLSRLGGEIMVSSTINEGTSVKVLVPSN